jgi:hypothetical protein
MTSERKGTSCLNSALLEYLQHMCRLESSVASPKTNQLKAGHATWDKSVVMSDAFCFFSLFCTIQVPFGTVNVFQSSVCTLSILISQLCRIPIFCRSSFLDKDLPSQIHTT